MHTLTCPPPSHLDACPPTLTHGTLGHVCLIDIKNPLPFDDAELQEALAVIEKYVLDDNGEPTKELRNYLVGWTLVPPNMMGGGLSNFAPHDALDGAGARMEASGEHCF